MGRRAACVLAINAALLLVSSPALAFTWLLPSGGETWTAGTTHKVEWTGGPASNVNVKIISMPANIVVGSVVLNVANAGYETWAIPPSLAPGTYLLYIEDTAVTTWTYGPTFTIRAAPQCGIDCSLVSYSVSNYGYPSGLCDPDAAQAMSLAQNYVLNNLPSSCGGPNSLDPSSILYDVTILPFGVCFAGYSGQYIAEASAVGCCCPAPTPAQPSTWGAVKAGYR